MSVSTRQLLEHLNRHICGDLERLPEVIVTFLACLLDTSTLTLSCANAGHLPAFILREDKAIRVLPEGMGLGFSPDARYEETVVPLARGDTIVLGTDDSALLSARVRQGPPPRPDRRRLSHPPLSKFGQSPTMRLGQGKGIMGLSWQMEHGWDFSLYEESFWQNHSRGGWRRSPKWLHRDGKNPHPRAVVGPQASVR